MLRTSANLHIFLCKQLLVNKPSGMSVQDYCVLLRTRFPNANNPSAGPAPTTAPAPQKKRARKAADDLGPAAVKKPRKKAPKKKVTEEVTQDVNMIPTVEELHDAFHILSKEPLLPVEAEKSLCGLLAHRTSLSAEQPHPLLDPVSVKEHLTTALEGLGAVLSSVMRRLSTMSPETVALLRVAPVDVDPIPDRSISIASLICAIQVSLAALVALVPAHAVNDEFPEVLAQWYIRPIISSFYPLSSLLFGHSAPLPITSRAKQDVEELYDIRSEMGVILGLVITGSHENLVYRVAAIAALECARTIKKLSRHGASLCLNDGEPVDATASAKVTAETICILTMVITDIAFPTLVGPNRSSDAATLHVAEQAVGDVVETLSGVLHSGDTKALSDEAWGMVLECAAMAGSHVLACV